MVVLELMLETVGGVVSGSRTLLTLMLSMAKKLACAGPATVMRNSSMPAKAATPDVSTVFKGQLPPGPLIEKPRLAPGTSMPLR